MHVEPTRGEPTVQVPTITCVLPMSQVVYTGDEDGKVVSLVLIDGRNRIFTDS
jgi:hypothetical protein